MTSLSDCSVAWQYLSSFSCSISDNLKVKRFICLTLELCYYSVMIAQRFTFRLYPTVTQEQELYRWRRMHKDLYNAAIANRKTQYERFGHAVDYFEQQDCLPAFKEVWHASSADGTALRSLAPEYKALGSHALQATLKRVDIAYQRFFKRIGGLPKFKSIRHYSGWTYPDGAGWKAHTIGDNGYLELSNLGQIQMRGRAKVWGTPTTCTIVYRHGKWYASVTVNCTLVPGQNYPKVENCPDRIRAARCCTFPKCLKACL